MLLREMNKVEKNYRYVCAVDSVYSLFLYCIICIDSLEETLFVFSDGIPEVLRRKFLSHVYISSFKCSKFSYLKRIIESFKLRVRLLKIFRQQKEPVVYAQDHLFYSFAVLSGNYILLEDGLGNYLTHEMSIKSIIRSFLLRGKEWGYNKRAQEIILTEMREIPVKIKDKCRIVKLPDLWNDIRDSNKKKLISIFMGGSEFDKKYEYVLLTQPFSEDGVLTEFEKVELYKEILKNYSDKAITIKPHPRETTDYEAYFDFPVLNREFPFQLLLLLAGVTKVITIFSSLPEDTKNITIDFYGTELSAKLIQRYGVIKASIYGK